MSKREGLKDLASCAVNSANDRSAFLVSVGNANKIRDAAITLINDDYETAVTIFHKASVAVNEIRMFRNYQEWVNGAAEDFSKLAKFAKNATKRPHGLAQYLWKNLRQVVLESVSEDNKIRDTFDEIITTLSPRDSLEYSMANKNEFWIFSLGKEGYVFRFIFNAQRTEGAVGLEDAFELRVIGNNPDTHEKRFGKLNDKLIGLTATEKMAVGIGIFEALEKTTKWVNMNGEKVFFEFGKPT